MPQIQVLPAGRPSTSQSIAQGLGEGLGKGISDVSKLTLAQKMNALEDQRKIDQQMAVVKSQAKNMRSMGGDYARFADIFEATGGDAPTAMKFMEYGFGAQQPQQTDFQGGFREPVSTQGPMQNLQALQPKGQGTGLPQYDMAIGQGVQPQMTQPAQFPKTQQQENIQQIAPTKEKTTGVPLKNLQEYAKDIDPRFNEMRGPAQKAVLDKAKIMRDADVATQTLEEKQAKGKREAEASAYTQHKAYVDKMRTLKSDSKETIKVLKELENLSQTEKLDSPILAKLSDKLGYPGLLSPQSNMFESSLKKFLTSGKAIFGSRMTNYDTQLLIKMFPTLLQSNAGRQAVSAQLRKMAEGEIIKAEAFNDIMRENKGVAPYDLEERVDALSEAKLNKNYEEFENLPFKIVGEQAGFKPVKEGTIIPVDVIKKMHKTFHDTNLEMKIAKSLNYGGLE